MVLNIIWSVSNLLITTYEDHDLQS